MSEEEQPRGVHNPRVVDLITPDADTGEIVLVMLEQRTRGAVPEQLRQLEDKFNAYLFRGRPLAPGPAAAASPSRAPAPCRRPARGRLLGC